MRGICIAIIGFALLATEIPVEWRPWHLTRTETKAATRPGRNQERSTEPTRRQVVDTGEVNTEELLVDQRARDKKITADAQSSSWTNVTQTPVSLMPNDPQFPSWECEQLGNCAQYFGELNAAAGTGRQAIVYVVDTGIKPHIDLDPVRVPALDVSALSGPINNSHGSSVASTVGTAANNGKSTAGPGGMGGRVGIASARFLEDDGSGSISNEVSVLDSIVAKKNAGQNVVAIVCAYGGIGGSIAERDAITRVLASGIKVFAAAGRGSAPGAHDFCPACYPGVVAVGPLNSTGDAFASSTDWGDFAEPTNVPVVSFLDPENGAAMFGGVSPCPGPVAGVFAALMAHRTTDPEEALRRLKAWAMPITRATFGRMNAYLAFTANPYFVGQNGDPNAAAVYDAVTHVAGPFSTQTDYFFAGPKATRVVLLAYNLGLPPGQPASAVEVRDNTGRTYQVENASPVPDHPFLTGITIVLPQMPAGTFSLSFTYNGKTSFNTVQLAIR